MYFGQFFGEWYWGTAQVFNWDHFYWFVTFLILHESKKGGQNRANVGLKFTKTVIWGLHWLCFLIHFTYFDQNQKRTSQAFIWDHFYYCLVILRFLIDIKVVKKGYKSECKSNINPFFWHLVTLKWLQNHESGLKWKLVMSLNDFDQNN